MFPKLVQAITQIKVVIMSYYPQYLAVIAHNIEQHCCIGLALPPEGLPLPKGVIYPQFENHWSSPVFSNRGAIYNTQEWHELIYFSIYHWKHIFKMSPNLKLNSYGVGTGCCKIYFSFVECHEPKKVGDHWCSPYLDCPFFEIGYMGVVVKQHR